ncbi:MAG: hypothetical protein GX640_04040 [Fibrobacter sp.]|nr:hypothetical protein [Fibrobacter sp.]
MFETISTRITTDFKKQILERCTDLKMSPSKYLKWLLERDLSNQDITESDKPLLTEFSRKIAAEFYRETSNLFGSFQTDSKRFQELVFALLFYNFRVSLLNNQTTSSRLKHGLKMGEEEAKKSDDEIRNNFNAALSKFTELFDRAKASDIMEFAKKVM